MLLLRYVGESSGIEWDNSQEDDEEGVSGVMRSFEGLDDGNIEEEGTSILMRSIENSEVQSTTFIVIGRTEDKTVFTNYSREGMISTNFKYASRGTVDALARTMLGTDSVHGNHVCNTCIKKYGDFTATCP